MRIFQGEKAGIRTYWHVQGDETIVVEKEFDREPVLDANARMRNEVEQTGDLRKLASIPTPLFFKLMREGRIGGEWFEEGGFVVDMVSLRKLLADPEFKYLATVDKV